MQKSAAANYFGGVPKLARVLGVTRQCVYKWPDQVPDLYQYKLHFLSDYKLPVSREARRLKSRLPA
jgi:hypothetical protein